MIAVSEREHQQHPDRVQGAQEEQQRDHGDQADAEEAGAGRVDDAEGPAAALRRGGPRPPGRRAGRTGRRRRSCRRRVPTHSPDWRRRTAPRRRGPTTRPVTRAAIRGLIRGNVSGVRSLRSLGGLGSLAARRLAGTSSANSGAPTSASSGLDGLLHRHRAGEHGGLLDRRGLRLGVGSTGAAPAPVLGQAGGGVGSTGVGSGTGSGARPGPVGVGSTGIGSGTGSTGRFHGRRGGRPGAGPSPRCSREGGGGVGGNRRVEPSTGTGPVAGRLLGAAWSPRARRRSPRSAPRPGASSCGRGRTGTGVRDSARRRCSRVPRACGE